jgi:hypothetical protein
LLHPQHALGMVSVLIAAYLAISFYPFISASGSSGMLLQGRVRLNGLYTPCSLIVILYESA